VASPDARWEKEDLESDSELSPEGVDSVEQSLSENIPSTPVPVPVPKNVPEIVYEDPADESSLDDGVID
jgi:hypothetical protein